ncbi:hypothetical protein GGI13_005074 [Coemansia sp. RSA 455]|nr:hypothetical protein GGI13_005074 [Coemansia sp. RSA 455]
MSKLSAQAVYDLHGTTDIVLEFVVQNMALGERVSVAFQKQFNEGFKVQIVDVKTKGYNTFMAKAITSNNVILAFTLVTGVAEGIEDANIQEAINRVKSKLGNDCDIKYAHTNVDVTKLLLNGLQCNQM